MYRLDLEPGGSPKSTVSFIGIITAKSQGALGYDHYMQSLMSSAPLF